MEHLDGALSHFEFKINKCQMFINRFFQWEKSPKKQSAVVYFWQYGTVFWVPN